MRRSAKSLIYVLSNQYCCFGLRVVVEIAGICKKNDLALRIKIEKSEDRSNLFYKAILAKTCNTIFAEFLAAKSRYSTKLIGISLSGRSDNARITIKGV